MWISEKVFGWFKVSEEAYHDLKEQNAALRAERDAVKSENATLRVSGDWLRIKVNQLEQEKAALMEKAYHVQLSVPTIARTLPAIDPQFDPRNFAGFEDVGDIMAKAMGLDPNVEQ